MANLCLCLRLGSFSTCKTLMKSNQGREQRVRQAGMQAALAEVSLVCDFYVLAADDDEVNDAASLCA